MVATFHIDRAQPCLWTVRSLSQHLANTWLALGWYPLQRLCWILLASQHFTSISRNLYVGSEGYQTMQHFMPKLAIWMMIISVIWGNDHKEGCGRVSWLWLPFLNGLMPTWCACDEKWRYFYNLRLVKWATFACFRQNAGMWCVNMRRQFVCYALLIRHLPINWCVTRLAFKAFNKWALNVVTVHAFLLITAVRMEQIFVLIGAQSAVNNVVFGDTHFPCLVNGNAY